MDESQPRTPDELLALLRRDISDERVLAAIQATPRDCFVPERLAQAAWENRPLPIGSGQTISQPLIVALMTQALAPRPADRVLEIGAGSGYQTAILARLAGTVISVERHAELRQRAGAVLARLGVTNVRLEQALTETLGFPEAAPYDGIIVTAAAPCVPPSLLRQLAPGGRLVIPVGDAREQELLLVTHTVAGLVERGLGPCRFVPLIGPEAWPADPRWSAPPASDQRASPSFPPG